MMPWKKLISLPSNMGKTEHVLIIGTRPEVIKCAPLVEAFQERGARDRLTVIFSGQQNGLMDSARTDVEPDIRMDDWPHGDRLREQRTCMVYRTIEVLKNMHCGAHTKVIVQGDTSTSYFAALAARSIGARIFHVEAGLRSGSVSSPFPEEFNRRSISRMAHLHYAPNDGAKNNLLNEGVQGSAILVTGNTGIDTVERIGMRTHLQRPDVVLITLHRQENRGRVVVAVLRAVQELASLYPALRFVWLGHSHPAVEGEIAKSGASPISNLCFAPPMAHEQLLNDQGSYALIMTDSGGLQEEATHLGIPLIILRERTERPEALLLGNGVLCPPMDHDRTISTFRRLVQLERRPNKVFGQGDASRRIVDHLLAYVK